MENEDVESVEARGLDEAVQKLSVNKAIDKHPEKRMKAAYSAFEEKRITQLKKEYPGLKVFFSFFFSSFFFSDWFFVHFLLLMPKFKKSNCRCLS